MPSATGQEGDLPMPIPLDIRTLSLTAGIVSLLLCACMLHVARTRKTYPGFSVWTAASVINCLGLVALSFRGFLPDLVTVVLANTLVVAGHGLIAHGLEIFTGSRRRPWLLITSGLLTAGSFLFYTYLSPSVNARIVIVSAFLAIFPAYAASLIHRHAAPSGRDRSLLLVAFGVQAAWFALRIIPAGLLEGPITDFMQASILHGFTFLVVLGGNLAVYFGLIILNSQRVEQELLGALAEVKTLRGILPICSYCKQVRDDQGYWDQVEAYVSRRTDARFTHGICPACMQRHHPEVDDSDEAEQRILGTPSSG